MWNHPPHWPCCQRPEWHPPPHTHTHTHTHTNYTFLLFPFFIPFVPSPSSHKSLFEVQVLNNGGDSSNTDDLSSSSSQTASRPQTFLRQVTMATVPPPLQPPWATVSQAPPPFSPNPLFSTPPPLDSSAASGRPPQQAAHAEMQDKGTKRVFVPPMTPQPLCIRGAALHWHSHRQAQCSYVYDWFTKQYLYSFCKVLQLMSMPMSSLGSSCHDVFGCDEVKWGELPPLTALL